MAMVTDVTNYVNNIRTIEEVPDDGDSPNNRPKAKEGDRQETRGRGKEGNERRLDAREVIYHISSSARNQFRARQTSSRSDREKASDLNS